MSAVLLLAAGVPELFLVMFIELQIDQVKDTSELLKVIYSAWGQITSILSKAFPDMEDADWENVKLSELVPILVTILKNSFAKIATIPTDEKNSMAE